MIRLARLALTLVALALITAPAQTKGQTQALGSKVASVEFLDVGQGDAILIRSPEGKTALVDAGPSSHVVRLLRDRGVTALDLAVVSHHYADHYGGLAAVRAAFPTRFSLATNSAHTTPQYLKLLERVRDQGIPLLAPTERPRKIDLGSVTLAVLPQPPEDRDEENDNSIGLRVQYGSVAWLLTGDSQAGERTWWERHCPELVRDATVLKLAHHGSRNGTDSAWLRLVRPRLAVISVGASNSYGHPSPETIALVERAGIPLMRTDRDGSIATQSDGRRLIMGEPAAGPRGPPVTAQRERADMSVKARPQPTTGR